MEKEELTAIIEDLLATSQENEWVEFKTNNFNPETIGEYISALSNGAAYMNQAKAYLVFGISDDHQIVGTDFKPYKVKIHGQEILNWLQTQLDPRIGFTAHEINYQGKNIVVFIIDAARGIPVKFQKKAWIRIGSCKQNLASFPMMEQKLWQNDQNHSFENQVAKSGVNEDEVLRLLDYPSIFRLLNIPLPENKTSILEKLTEEKIINRRPSCYDITNLGAILFARDLEKFDSLARKTIRVIFYRDDSRINAVREIVNKKGYAVGFEGLIETINDNIPSNEEIGKVLRKTIPAYPPVAIREFVANALIHQDFSLSGCSSMIELFPKRLEITNPGAPLIDTLRFIDHSPISRNEGIASLMRRMNFCEERGSGVDRALTQCEMFQLPAPNFITEELFTKVIMLAPLMLNQMDKWDKIRACYQHCCLLYVAGKKMTNETLRERLNIDKKNYSIASRIIADTINEHLIKLSDPKQSRKNAQYVPVWA